MAILATIGRRSWAARMLVLILYALLVTGAISMVYPFLLMLAGSTKSDADRSELRVIPAFLTDDGVLWAKHVEGLFNESLEMMRMVHGGDEPAFEKARPPASPNAALVEAWREFLGQAKLPHYACTIGYLHTPNSRSAIPMALRAFKGEIIDRFGGDIHRCNTELGTEFIGWNNFYVLAEQHLQRRDKPLADPLSLALRDFKGRSPVEDRYCFSAEGFYRERVLKTRHTRSIAAYNKAHGTSHNSYAQVHLDRRLPDGPGRTDLERKEWTEFVRELVNLLWLRADPQAAGPYRRFLAAKYRDIATFNRAYGTRYAAFQDVPLVDEPPEEGLVLTDWGSFLQGWKDPDTQEEHILPLKMVRIHSVEFLFRDWLRARHGTIEGANAALGTSFADWMDILPPQRDLHCLAFRERRSDLRWEFSLRNYVAVLDYMVLHGRGIVNTAIYCALAVLGALMVNPLAAYALSRYKPPSAYKVLLFLMLTMAFPPVVTQIPRFIMLRGFDLLNTFWALILPGLANGYFIFMLKGFFDSQPRELYESAALDGAGEFRIFWQITMGLSKPILAVTALSAFTAAYSDFMFALLLCQDNQMWTLMVWLYDLQQRSGQGVVFASLIIAALPVFLMFLLCQNIIMRGIVVPVEK